MKKKKEKILYNVTIDKAKAKKEGKASIKETKPYFKYFKEHKFLIFVGTLLMIATTFLSLLSAVYGGRLLASFTENFNYKVTIKIGVEMTLLGVASIIIGYLSNIVWAKNNTLVGISIKRDLIRHINSLNQKCFDQSGTNFFYSRIGRDLYNIKISLYRIIDHTITVLGGLGFLAYTFTLNVYVGLFLVVYIAAFLIIREVQVRIRNRNTLLLNSIDDEYGSLELENIRSIKDVKNINTTKQIENKIYNENRKLHSYDFKITKIDGFWNVLRSFILDILNCLFVVLCAFLILKGHLMIAGFMIAYNYKGRILSFASSLANLRSTFAYFAVSAKRVNELYDENKFPREKFGNEIIENVKGDIEFKDVKFGYYENTPVLKGISFKINAHSIVSFVGESGCGKSTIISLINKIYALNENSGEILLDGHNINDLTCDCLRNNVCVVSQNPYIFDVSVRENLLLAKPDATDDELWNALKKAEEADFINSLDKKLDSKLGENGIKLSGGQKQRLAIARSILKDSKVLIFDEATSALDNDNQAKIKSVIKGLSKDKTIIMVAHRLSTVIDSDKIFFIAGGKVLAEGTHDYLMQNCTEYKHLYEVEDNSDN